MIRGHGRPADRRPAGARVRARRTAARSRATSRTSPPTRGRSASRPGCCPSRSSGASSRCSSTSPARAACSRSGTYTGYSALCVAEALPEDGRIVTCEVDPDHARMAAEHIAGTPFRDRIEIRLGRGLKTARGPRGAVRPRPHRRRAHRLRRLRRRRPAQARARRLHRREQRALEGPRPRRGADRCRDDRAGGLQRADRQRPVARRRDADDRRGPDAHPPSVELTPSPSMTSTPSAPRVARTRGPRRNREGRPAQSRVPASRVSDVFGAWTPRS